MKPGIVFILILFTRMTMAQNVQIRGRVIGDDLEKLPAAEIRDNRAGTQTESDADGFYFINAAVGDTLTFNYVGYTIEKRKVLNSTENVNVLLINKDLNDLGSDWSNKQWKKAEKEIDRRYKKLEKKAARSGKWRYVWLTGIDGPKGVEN